MSIFPGAIPSFTGFTSSHTLSQDQHASQHNSEQSEIVAIATKIGTGSSTPASGKLLRGTGAGTSSWAQADLTTDVAGVLPQANGGTGTTLATGTGKAVYDTSPTIITPVIVSFVSATHNHQNSAGGGTLAGLALQNNAVTFTQLALGVPVQVVSTNFSAVATGATVIPTDDTIPQNNEGDEYMTQAITPKSATNRLLIEATLILSNSSGAADMIAALFQDATVNAIAATLQTMPTTTYIQNLTLRHDMVAGTIAATTFKIRGGGSSAGTTTFNGQAGVRRFGGITISNIKITEYNA